MKLLLILKILPVTLFRASETLIFYPKNAYRNPPLFLNIIPETALDMYVDTGENHPVTERE
jgi:hypothetical protein